MESIDDRTQETMNKILEAVAPILNTTKEELKVALWFVGNIDETFVLAISAKVMGISLKDAVEMRKEKPSLFEDVKKTIPATIQ